MNTTVNVYKLCNEFAQVLCRITQDNTDPYIHREDFIGTLGIAKYNYLNYCRVILRTWYMNKTYLYLYGLITKEEYAIVRREYRNKDRQFWNDGPHSAYHSRKALPLL